MYYEIPKDIKARRKELSGIFNKSYDENSEDSILAEIAMLAEDGYFVETKRADLNGEAVTSVWINGIHINWVKELNDLSDLLSTAIAMTCVKKGVA